MDLECVIRFTKKYLLGVFLVLPMWVMAEYNGHQLEFTIELKNGGEIKGYSYLATVYMRDNSVTYQEFLEKNYTYVLGGNMNGELTYFEHRIKYNFMDNAGNAAFIYTLMDEKHIDRESIKALHILSMTEQSYTIGISSKHAYKDTLWMNTPVVESFYITGYWCEHTIFVHKNTSKVQKLKVRLEQLVQNYEKRLEELEDSKNYLNGKEYRQADKDIETLSEKIDEEISNLLSEYEGEKVVILSVCTC